MRASPSSPVKEFINQVLSDGRFNRFLSDRRMRGLVLFSESGGGFRCEPVSE
jgi:hypothetical protein